MEGTQPQTAAVGQRPTIGRVVHYALNGGPNVGKPRPAIITDVISDTLVNLTVFPTPGDTHGAFIQVSSCQRTDDPQQVGCWFWPPRF